jgi:hypothetical protein
MSQAQIMIFQVHDLKGSIDQLASLDARGMLSNIQVLLTCKARFELLFCTSFLRLDTSPFRSSTEQPEPDSIQFNTASL